MWVIPEGCGFICDCPIWSPGFARFDDLMWASVHGCRQFHAMPVHRCGFSKVICDIQSNLVASMGADCWAKIISVIAPCFCCLSLKDFRLALLSCQIKHLFPIFRTVFKVRCNEKRVLGDKLLVYKI